MGDIVAARAGRLRGIALQRAAQRDIRTEVGAVEGLAQGGQQFAVNGLAVAEAHLNLGRMDVDVDLGGVNGDEDHRDGEAVRVGHAAIGLAKGVRHETVADKPAVEEEILPVARGPREPAAWRPGRQRRYPGRNARRWAAARGASRPKTSPARRAVEVVAGKFCTGLPVVREREGDLRMRVGPGPDDLLGAVAHSVPRS